MREHGFIKPVGFNHIGYFSIRKKAEKFMRQCVADSYYSDTYAFFITERVVDGVRFTTRFACKSYYSYMADGTLNDYSDVGSMARYYGRTPDRIHFQVGDIVEMWHTAKSNSALWQVLHAPWRIARNIRNYARKDYGSISIGNRRSEKLPLTTRWTTPMTRTACYYITVMEPTNIPLRFLCSNPPEKSPRCSGNSCCRLYKNNSINDENHF